MCMYTLTSFVNVYFSPHIHTHTHTHSRLDYLIFPACCCMCVCSYATQGGVKAKRLLLLGFIAAQIDCVLHCKTSRLYLGDKLLFPLCPSWCCELLTLSHVCVCTYVQTESDGCFFVRSKYTGQHAIMVQGGFLNLLGRTSLPLVNPPLSTFFNLSCIT